MIYVLRKNKLAKILTTNSIHFYQSLYLEKVRFMIIDQYYLRPSNPIRNRH